MKREKTRQQLSDELTACRKDLDAANRSLARFRERAEALEREIASLAEAADESSTEQPLCGPAPPPDPRKAADRIRAVIGSEKRYRHLIAQANDIIYCTDDRGHLTMFNGIAVKLLGYSEKEIMGSDYRDMVPPDYLKRVEKFYGLQFVRRTPDSYLEIPLKKKSGDIIWIGQNVQLLRDNDTVIGFQAIARDITDRKRAEDALRESEQKHRAIIENIQEGYYEVDLYGRLTFYNDSLVRILGYPREALPILSYRQFMDRKTALRVFRTFHAVYKTRRPAKALDWALIRCDGGTSFVEVSVSLITDSLDRPIGFRGIAQDITEQKKLEEELRRLSITDNLTGLFNQRHFYVKIAEESKRAQRMAYPLCLIIFDLDDFKAYNDTYGHLAGDEVLRMIGEIIKSSIRQNVDTGYRYGGDEFAVILPSSIQDEARKVADRIRMSIVRRVYGIDISVGIAALKTDEPLMALIHAADTAMYLQKGARKKRD
jgi:diguanylate cyclase (GGDEF)-like protein/PAS domain S-box-containing protein